MACNMYNHIAMAYSLLVISGLLILIGTWLIHAYEIKPGNAFTDDTEQNAFEVGEEYSIESIKKRSKPGEPLHVAASAVPDSSAEDDINLALDDLVDGTPDGESSSGKADAYSRVKTASRSSSPSGKKSTPASRFVDIPFDSLKSAATVAAENGDSKTGAAAV